MATVRTITEYREAIASSVARHGGRVVDAPGDNVLAEFASVVDAVESAVEIQRELRSRNGALPVTRQMQFRIGINLGDVIVEGPRLYGDRVNIAARLEGLAEGGGVCLSGTAYDQVEGKLPLGYDFIGEHSVKNIARPVRVYRLRFEPGTIQPAQAAEPEFRPGPRLPCRAVRRDGPREGSPGRMGQGQPAQPRGLSPESQAAPALPTAGRSGPVPKTAANKAGLH